jgi:hypothetical protein
MALKFLRAVRASFFDRRAVHLSTTLAHYENQESTSELKVKIQRLKRLINIECMQNPIVISTWLSLLPS